MSMATETGTFDRSLGGGADWALGINARTSPTPAVRGTSRGSVGWSGADEGSRLATFLGLFSVGLGVAQVLAPRELTRLVGLDPTDRRSAFMRLMGVREIGHGVGILRNPLSKEWVGTRVAGDFLDLGALGVALATASRRPERTALAAAAVFGVTVLDVLCTEQLSQSRKAPTREANEAPGTSVRKSITIDRPRAEVYRYWRNLENLPRFMRHLESVRDLGGGRSRWVAASGSVEWDAEIVEDRENERIAWRSLDASDLYNAGVVHFTDSPEGTGTIVRVEMQYAPPGGKIGAAMLKIVRREPGQQVGDDLRRFKQVLETGEVVLSDATAVSPPHAAQPSERAARDEVRRRP